MSDSPDTYVFQANAAAATTLLLYKQPLYWDVHLLEAIDPDRLVASGSDERLGLTPPVQDEVDAYFAVRERVDAGKSIPPELLRARFLARSQRFRKMSKAYGPRFDEIMDESIAEKRNAVSSEAESDGLSDEVGVDEPIAERALVYRGASLAQSYFNPETTSEPNFRLITAFAEAQLFSALANNAEKFAGLIDQIIESGVIDLRDTKHFSGATSRVTPGDTYLWGAEKSVIDYLVDRYIRAAHDAWARRLLEQHSDQGSRPDFLLVTSQIISVGNTEVAPLLGTSRRFIIHSDNIELVEELGLQFVYQARPLYKSLDGKSPADDIISSLTLG